MQSALICDTVPAMEETIVSISSAGLRLHGALGRPADLRPGEKRLAFLVLHGFGTNSESEGVRQPTRVLNLSLIHI